MPTLRIHRGHQVYTVDFDSPERISVLLARAGQALIQPCGGRGVCGKCAVLLEGNGAVLSCQTTIHTDAVVILPEAQPMEQIEAGSGVKLTPVQPMQGRLGAAIDIGTTTLALNLYDLCTGTRLAVSTMLNPQTTVAADVIGRISAAMNGRLLELKTSIEEALQTLLRTACAQVGCNPDDVESLVVTGNTTMLYLLTGRDPTCLSYAPFKADTYFGSEYTLLGRHCYLPHCLHAFVGADTACALLASGMLNRSETALLCDIGTNGELALWHHGQLYIASTAAGPAFEGAGISCGCGSIPGAIDRVVVKENRLSIHTISNKKPVGLCGSGLIDAAASLLKMEIIDETGAMIDDVHELAEGVSLSQGDIRTLQLAKAAMAAGMDSLLHAAGCPKSEISAVYLAGGFGSHLNVESAVQIGLVALSLADRMHTIGNAALNGAAMLLMNGSLCSQTEDMCRKATHIRLDGNAYFSQRFVDAMMFESYT